MRPANPAGGIWGRQAYPAPRSSAGAGGRCCVLRDDALGAGRDALAGGDADLDGLLDAVRDGGDALCRGLGDAGEALGHDVVAAVGLALDAVGLALELAAGWGGGGAPPRGGGGLVSPAPPPPEG